MIYVLISIGFVALVLVLDYLRQRRRRRKETDQ
jgi:hypothetical protein